MSQCKEYSRTQIDLSISDALHKVELGEISRPGHLFLFPVPPSLLFIPHLPSFYFPPPHTLGSGNMRDGIASSKPNKYGTEKYFLGTEKREQHLR